MALPASGRLALSDIASEFGDTAPSRLSEFYGSGGVPASGVLKLSDFYGVSAGSNSPIMVPAFDNDRRYGFHMGNSYGSLSVNPLPGLSEQLYYLYYYESGSWSYTYMGFLNSTYSGQTMTVTVDGVSHPFTFSSSGTNPTRRYGRVDNDVFNLKNRLGQSLSVEITPG